VERRKSRLRNKKYKKKIFFVFFGTGM